MKLISIILTFAGVVLFVAVGLGFMSVATTCDHTSIGLIMLELGGGHVLLLVGGLIPYVIPSRNLTGLDPTSSLWVHNGYPTKNVLTACFFLIVFYVLLVAISANHCLGFKWMIIFSANVCIWAFLFHRFKNW